MIPGSNKDHPSFLKSFSYAMEASSPPLRPSATLRSCSWRACAPSLPAASWGSTLPSGPRLSSAVLGDSRELCNTAMERSSTWRPRSSIRWQSVRRISPPPPYTYFPSPPRLWDCWYLPTRSTLFRKGFSCPTICSLSMKLWTTSPWMRWMPKRPRIARMSRNSIRLRA